MSEHPCRHCGGSKFTRAFVFRQDGCGPDVVDCGECTGSGIDPEYPVEWDTIGEVLRKLRRDKGYFLYEAAEACGITIVELSNAELGKANPQPYLSVVLTLPDRKTTAPPQPAES